MATKYADVFADLTADSTGETQNQKVENFPSGNRFQRHLKVARARYTFKGDEAAGDVIRLFKLKKGCSILTQQSGIFTLVDAGAAMTIDVGDEDTLAPTPLVDSDADRYCDGVDCGAVGYDAFANGAAATQRMQLGSDCWITATIATLSTPSDVGLLEFEIFYLEPGPAETAV